MMDRDDDAITMMERDGDHDADLGDAITMMDRDGDHDVDLNGVLAALAEVGAAARVDADGRRVALALLSIGAHVACIPTITIESRCENLIRLCVDYLVCLAQSKRQERKERKGAARFSEHCPY